MDCIFCKIAKGEIPADKIFENESLIAFNDLDPKAPVHFLVIPKAHIKSVSEIDEHNKAIVGDIFAAISSITKELGLENGYRVVTNCGADGGQSVDHLHYHVLGGRSLTWPPG